MKSFLTVHFTLLVFLSFSQRGSEVPYVGVADAYVIALEFKQLVYQHKCICGMEGIVDSERCSLYQVSIDSVLLSRDTSVYSSEDLKEVRYVVISSKEPLNLGKAYIAFCSNSTSQEYLVINKLIDIGTNYEYATTMPVFTGLVSCYKYSIWQKIAMLFGASREKINRKARERFNVWNPFDRVVKEHHSQLFTN